MVIEEKESQIEEVLMPYLQWFNIDFIWLGANEVLKMESNPDRVRHSLVSLRTLLEYFINEKLAPNNQFAPFLKEQKKLGDKRDKRELQIEFFLSKVNFGVLDELTKECIKYICACYSVLCNLHQIDVNITVKQMRSIKIKVGVTIWLLAHINKIINEE